jgi:hypothetical protein
MRFGKNFLLFMGCVLLALLIASHSRAQSTIYDGCKSVFSQVPQYTNSSAICRCVVREAPSEAQSRQQLSMHFAKVTYICLKKFGSFDPYAPETRAMYRKRCFSSLKAQNFSESEARKVCDCSVKVHDNAAVNIMDEMEKFDDWNSFEIWRNDSFQRQISACVAN